MTSPSTLTLASLLDLAGWRERVRVLGGRPTGRRVAATALVTDRVRPQPGVLVAVASDPSSGGSAWRLDALLRRAADAGASAVLLPSTADLGAPTRLLCSRLELCVLGSDGDVLDLLTEASVALAAPAVVRARTVSTVHRGLASGRGDGPARLVTLVADALGVPTAVLDRGGQHLEGPAEGAGLRVPRPAEPLPQRAASPAGTTLAHPVLLPGLPAVQRWLVAWVPSDREDAVETAADCLAAGAVALAGRLATDRLVLERDARARTALLADVLRGGDDAPAPLRRRAAASGWPLDGWHVGVHVSTGEAVDNAGLRADALAAFAAAGTELVLVEQDDGWTGWWTAPREPSAEQVRALAASLRTAHRDLQESTHCATGVGRPHPGPGGIAATLAEASDAARLAGNRPERGRFLHVDQLGVAQTLLAWTRTSTFEPAAQTLLAPLGPPDGELVRTLAAYLDAESSVTETAAVLGVHRNTVAARTARVEQLLHVDLGDPDQRLALHLACRALTS